MTDPYYTAAESLAAALPAKAGPISQSAREAILSLIRSSTPGRHTEPWWKSQGALFVDIFFPSRPISPYQANVDQIFGFGGGWWSNFAISMLCQSFYHITSNIRTQMLIDKINSDVNSRNGSITGKSADWYGFVLKQAFQPFKDAVASVPDPAQLAQTYRNYLSQDPWILMKKTQWADGNWPDADWELFNHWVKLQQVGLGVAEINALIAEIKAKGLMIPAKVDAGAWTSYREWSAPLYFSWSDIRGIASPGILAEHCEVYPGAMFPSCMKEENCYEFTANSQPGNTFRQPPGASCFSGETKVLMADKSARRIDEVARGDRVATPNGDAEVLAIGRPHRNGRTLFGVNAIPAAFTETHPFGGIDKKERAGPGLRSINPMATIQAVPTLSELGVAKICIGGKALAGWDPETGVSVDVPVTSVEEYPADTGGDDERLYDLIVEVGQAAPYSEYLVGRPGGWLIAASEIPRADTAPEAAKVLTEVVDGAWPVIDSAMKGLEGEDYDAVLGYAFTTVSTNLVSGSIAEIQFQDTVAVSGAPAEVPDPAATLNKHARSYGEFGQSLAAETSSQRKGQFMELFAMLSGAEIRDAIRLGWRRFRALPPGPRRSILALCLLDIELTGAQSLGADSDLIVEITLNSACTSETQQAPDLKLNSTTDYYYPFYAPLYFSTWRPEDDEAWNIEMILSRSNGELIPLSIAGALPNEMEHGYRRFSCVVLDADQVPVGIANFDARALDAASFVEETQAKSAWKPGDEAAFANALTPAMVGILENTFPPVSKAFRGSARIRAQTPSS